MEIKLLPDYATEAEAKQASKALYNQTAPPSDAQTQYACGWGFFEGYGWCLVNPPEELLTSEQSDSLVAYTLNIDI